MTVMVYRTQDGLTNYGFSIDFQPDRGWRVYIIFRPVCQGLDDNQALPYQAIDREGRRYVDWSEKLDNLGDARTVATFWAELVQDYHRSQVKKVLDDELIERCRRAQDRSRVVPHSRAPVESMGDLQESA